MSYHIREEEKNANYHVPLEASVDVLEGWYQRAHSQYPMIHV